MRGHALLPALWLLISVLALHVEARLLPNMFQVVHDSKGDRDDPECGPLQKHRYRCDPPLTQNIQADSETTPTGIHDTSSIQGDRFHLAPTKTGSSGADEQTQEITKSTSGAAEHEENGIEVVPTLPSLTPTSEGNGDGPACGPLEKHRYRCTPPLTRIRDIHAVVP